MGSPSPPGSLFICHVNHAFGSAFIRFPHRQYIGGVNRREVANIACERSTRQSRGKRRQIITIIVGRIGQHYFLIPKKYP
jgi:hypothetical protein